MGWAHGPRLLQLGRPFEDVGWAHGPRLLQPGRPFEDVGCNTKSKHPNATIKSCNQNVHFYYHVKYMQFVNYIGAKCRLCLYCSLWHVRCMSRL